MNNKAISLVFVLSISLYACAAITPLIADAVLGTSSKGGINTEIVVGDKEQVLGSNIEVKAKTVGKVVGTSDNSVTAPAAKEVTVTNNTLPVWSVLVIIALASLVGWLSPRPEWIKRVIKRKTP